MRGIVYVNNLPDAAVTIPELLKSLNAFRTYMIFERPQLWPSPSACLVEQVGEKGITRLDKGKLLWL